MYIGKYFVGFKLKDLWYLVNLLIFLKDQQTKYIPSQNDVMAYVIAALVWTVFADPPSTASNLIL
jgi:hypothetical protein